MGYRSALLLRNIAIFVFLVLLFVGSYLAAGNKQKGSMVPSIKSCYVGSEESLIEELSKPVEIQSEDIYFFRDTDEANYLRNIEQWRLGVAPYDIVSLGVNAFFLKKRKNLRVGIDDEAEIASEEQAIAGKDRFVSYRSVIFPLLFLPFYSQLGCSSEALLELRQDILSLRAFIPVMVFMLVYMTARKRAITKGTISSVLVGFNSQLTEMGGVFMPEIPAMAILLLMLILLESGVRSGAWIYFVLVGLLSGLLALVKFDFVYILPVSFGVLIVLYRKQGIAKLFSLSVFFYFLVICGYAQRNHDATGVYFITSKDAINLWMGNSSKASDRGYGYGLSFDERPHDISDLTNHEKDILYKNGVELALREYYRRRLFSRIVVDPLGVVSGIGHKAILVATNSGVNLYPALGRSGYYLGLALGFIAWLGMGALILGKWRINDSPVLTISICIYFLSFVLVSFVFVLPRFLSHITSLSTLIAVCFLVDLLPRLPLLKSMLRKVGSCG